MKLVKAAVIFILLALLFVGIYAAANLNGWMIKKSSPEGIAALIAPHISVLKPQGSGPFPTILMFHGCGGNQDQQVYWAKNFQEWGFAAVIVNSFVGRGIDSERALSHVCQGRQLIGGERAGDVFTAIAWVKQQLWVDTNALTLAGWSHGAWSIMDAFALEKMNSLPHNLNAAPNADLKEIANLVLFYPYCGIADQGSEKGWNHHPATLALTAEHDSIVGDHVCDRSFAAIKQSALHFQHKAFSGVDHGFDFTVAIGDTGWEFATPLANSIAATNESKRLIHAFLKRKN